MIDVLNLNRRVDEDIRLALLPNELAIATGGGLKHSNSCRPDRNGPRAGIDRGCRRFGNQKSLFVHAMIGDLFALHRLESSATDMQGNESVRQLRQNLGSEMQSR